MGQLAELEYDHTWHEKERAGDEKLHVRFYVEVLPDEEASQKTGMRKFRDAVIVAIVVPGDKRNITIREARPDDMERFAKQYAAFKENQEEFADGTPLKEWAAITRAMAEEFRYLGFHTVEQIAKASDGIVSKYPGLREVQSRAKIWLEAQAGAAPAERLQNELKVRDEQLAAMQAQIAEMTKALAGLKTK